VYSIASVRGEGLVDATVVSPNWLTQIWEAFWAAYWAGWLLLIALLLLLGLTAAAVATPERRAALRTLGPGWAAGIVVVLDAAWVVGWGLASHSPAARALEFPGFWDRAVVQGVQVLLLVVPPVAAVAFAAVWLGRFSRRSTASGPTTRGAGRSASHYRDT
jgi:hypothetical protein